MNLRLRLPYLIFLFLGLFFFLPNASGQFMTGYRLDRYSGVQSTYLQPAALAGSPLRADLQLGGFDFLLWNSYLGLRRQTIADSSLFQIDAADPTIIPENLNGRAKQVYLEGDLHLPGLAFRIGPKVGVGIYGRYRTLLSLDQLGEPGARFSYYDRDVEDQFGIEYVNDRLRFTFASFLELGAGAGVTVWEQENRRLKAGINLKVNAPVFGTYLYAEELTYRFDNEDTLDILNIRMETGRSTLGGEPIPYTQLPERFPRPQFSQLGWGLDLGLLYEQQDSTMEAEGFPYRWRVGLALIDLGKVNFTRDDDMALLEGQALDLPIGFWDADGVAFFDSTLSSELTVTRDPGDFSLRLPMSIGINGDYRFKPSLAMQWDIRMGLLGSGVPNAFRPPFMATLVPRWENKWFSVGLPMTVDGQNQFAMGAILRAGPLTVGSGNVLGYFLTDNIRSADVYATLHVPIPYRPRKPKAPKPEEAQPEEPPIIATVPQEAPTPDTTSTPAAPVTDPEPPVLAETPTPDTSAIPEPLAPIEPKPDTAVAVVPTPTLEPEPTPVPVEPEKPRVTEPVNFLSSMGPPVIVVGFSVTSVPIKRRFPPMPPVNWEGLDEPGPEVDSIGPAPTPRMDVSSLTPEQIAEIERKEEERRRNRRNNPVPATPEPVAESETEPVEDIPYQPASPTLYGSGDYAQYMPYADPDGDGVPNKDDDCPDKAGPAERGGCPEDDPRGDSSLESVPENPAVEAFERVYFDYDESYLNGRARVSLNQVARFLRENPEADLEIWGHADAHGSNPYNDRLSERRCEAVWAYLVTKGISEERLIIMPVGERLPMASNSTEEGRQRNRRVELVLVDR